MANEIVTQGNPLEIQEYRGIRNLVAALLQNDRVITTDGGVQNILTYGAVFHIAGIAELSVSSESSSAAHYYDNFAAITIDAGGADTVSCSCSAIPLDVLAVLTGQTYDDETHMLIGSTSSAKKPYFAIGYNTEDTDGNEIYVWRNKVKVNAIPESTHATKDDGTDANGQTLEFTGIDTTVRDGFTGKHFASTLYQATKDGGRITEEEFFSQVMTPGKVRSAIGVTA